MGDDVHNEDKQQSRSRAGSADAGCSRRAHCVAAVGAVPLSMTGPLQKTRIARAGERADHAQADELVPVRAGPP